MSKCLDHFERIFVDSNSFACVSATEYFLDSSSCLTKLFIPSRSAWDWFVVFLFWLFIRSSLGVIEFWQMVLACYLEIKILFKVITWNSCLERSSDSENETPAQCETLPLTGSVSASPEFGPSIRRATLTGSAAVVAPAAAVAARSNSGRSLFAVAHFSSFEGACTTSPVLARLFLLQYH